MPFASSELKDLHAAAAADPEGVADLARAALAASPEDPAARAWAHLALGACSIARTDVEHALESLAASL